MHKVFILYKEGKIKPVIDSIFTFEDVQFICFVFLIYVHRIILIIQINNALGKLIDRKNIGKVVIEPFLNTKAEKVKKVKKKIKRKNFFLE